MIEGCSRSRAQVGIGTLIVFIAMVLVAALAAGVVIDTSAFLSSKGEHAGKQSSDKVQNRIQVMESTALRTSQDETTTEKTIGGVELLVTKAPGSDDFFLTSVTIQWVDNTGTYSLVHENHFEYNDDGSADLDGAFAHEPIRDQDGSLQSSSAGEPAITNQEDKASVVIDIGQNDIYEDNRIGNAYDNHTYHKNDLSYVKEEDVREDLKGTDLSQETTNSDYEVLYNNDKNENTSYAVGTVIRSDVRHPGGLGLRKQRDAQLSLTTGFGTTTRVRITVPQTLTESTALRV